MKKYILILVAGILAASCNLDQYPYSEVAADDYVKDEASVNNLLMGAYNGLHGVMYYEWAMTELRTDNARSRAAGSSSSETKLVEQLDQNTIQSSHAWVQDYWDASYTAIYRANDVLSYLDVVADPQKRAQFEGEAKFLRSLLYFNLVRLWGPVFYVTGKIGADAARDMQRSTVDKIYGLIEDDLNAIVDGDLLPESMAADDLGRADMKAAKALLAKVYMTHYQVGDENYAKAETLLKAVLLMCGDPQSAGALVPYADIFDINNEMNDEIIFAVRYLSGNVGLGSPFSTLFGPMNNGGNVVMGSPKHYDYPSDNLVAAYNANGTDLRKDVVLREGYTDAVSGKYVEIRWNNKFMQSSMTTEYDAENDWPVIRLGDVILLYAEILNELHGPSDEPLKYLNMIRERAGVPVYSLTDVASKFEMRQAIRNERRLELAMENQRWFDLVRWGIATETVNDFLASETLYSEYDYVVNPISDWQCLLPVPLSVMNVNPDIAQNPGY